MSIYDTQNIGKAIAGNPYVGRGILLGLTEDGAKLAVAYFIMGRSENSRNRIFTEQDSEVIIYPFDESKVEDPSLIIYSPIKMAGNALIVTNGDQTQTIYDFLQEGKTFEEALRTRQFEPDAPNLTPRISGIAYLNKDSLSYKLSILKSADATGTACNRYTFEYEPIAGLGHFIHTYVTDGNPIPTFQGEPERIQVPNSIDELTNDLWENLNDQNKISLYVRYVDLATGETENRMLNKNQ